jgi:HPt (histidine-containing phosphotransfer) domain-containing protein
MDMEMVKKMVVDFFREKIQELEQCIAKEDYVEIKQIAHNVKGNSGSAFLGLMVFNDLGKQLEEAAEAQDIANVQLFLDQLKREYANLLQ